MFLEDPRFPACPSFGYTSSPMYSVTPTKTAGGHEVRNRNWERPLHQFNCTVGPRTEADIAELLEMWHALGGIFIGFRFKDWVDFKSCRIHQTPTPLDQPLVIDSETAGTYQLVKRYEFGAATQDREIVKPVAGTIRIADNGIEKTEGVDWDLDSTTGIVTLNFSPIGSLTWGGEFDVPCRFASEFPVEILNKQIQSVTFVMEELRATDDEILT